MQKKSAESFSWKDLAKSVWFILGISGIRKKFVILMAVLFVAMIYNVIPPIILGLFVNFFTKYKIGDSLRDFYLIIAFGSGSYVLMSNLRLTIKAKLGMLRNIIFYQVNVKGFEYLLSQSLLENSKHTAGEKAQKIKNGLDSLGVLFLVSTNQIMNAVVSFGAIVFIFLFIQPIFAIFALVYFCIFFINLRFFRKRAHELNYQKNKALEKSGGALIEGLNNITTLKSLGSEKAFQARIVSKEDISKSFSDQIVRTVSNQWKAFETINGISAGIFLFLLGKNVLSGGLNIGEVVIFYSYFDRMSSVGNQIMNIYNDLIQSKMGIGIMMEIFTEGIKKEKIGNKFPKEWNEMVIESGTFMYKPEAGIKNLNIKIKKGEKIGVVGKTGSGKSTLSKILLGLYKLKKGKYKIDEVDFYSLKKDEIFENISVVPQDVEMFNMTLAENINLYRKIETSLFEKAIEIAQLQELVDSLPQGMNTIMGEKGYKLSGGERQRVAIARSICQKSQILILDEATSSLDFKTEKLIYEGLEKNFPEKTIIAIAHRVKTLENTDRIYVFEKGEIVETGKYADLIKNEESFLHEASRQK